MLQRVLVRLGTGLGLGILLMSVAQADEPRFEFTPFFTQRAGGGFSDVDNNDINLLSKSGLAVAIDWPASEHGSQYELLFSKQSTRIDTLTPIAMQIEYLQIGGTTLLGDQDAHVVPFAAGGLGVARFSPSDASLTQETRMAFNLGGGVRIPIAKHVRLRFEARGYLTWLNGSSSLFCDSSSTTCPIHARGQTLFQYEALGGVSFGF